MAELACFFRNAGSCSDLIDPLPRATTLDFIHLPELITADVKDRDLSTGSGALQAESDAHPEGQGYFIIRDDRQNLRCCGQLSGSGL